MLTFISEINNRNHGIIDNFYHRRNRDYLIRLILTKK